MPANRLSLYVTDSYRQRLQAAHQTYEGLIRSAWSRVTPDTSFDDWLRFALPAVMAAQQEARRSAAGYLTAFLVSELETPQQIDLPTQPIGQSYTGKPLGESLKSPMIGMLWAEKNGQDGIRLGLNRAVRIMGLEIDNAAKTPALQAIETDERFLGWQRAVKGTCGACIGSWGPGTGQDFPQHPNCQCVYEPRVRGVRDTFSRPTGDQLFKAMDEKQQDASFGPKAAQAVRDGLPVSALVGKSKQAKGDDFITQAQT